MASLNDNLGELNTKTAVLATAMKGVAVAISGLKKGFEFLDKTQKDAIKFGLSTQQVQARLGDSIDSLNGSIDRKLNTSIATLNAGINGNIEGVNTLINEQQILGQTYKRTATTFAKLEATAGFNNTQLGDLAVVVDKNRVQYNRSTEFLVDSLEQISDQFTSLSLQEGLANPVIEAYTELTGSLGPSLGNSLSMAFKTLISPEFDTISKRALLGIPEFGDFLFNLRDSKEGIAGFRKAFITAKDTIMQFTGGVYSREVIRDVFGPGGEAIVNVARALENLSEEQIKEYQEQARTNELFSVALEQIFDPLKQVVIDLAPEISESAEKLSDAVKEITKDEGLRDYLETAGLKILQFTETFGNALYQIIDTFDDTIIFGDILPEVDIPQDLIQEYKEAAKITYESLRPPGTLPSQVMGATVYPKDSIHATSEFVNLPSEQELKRVLKEVPEFGKMVFESSESFRQALSNSNITLREFTDLYAKNSFITFSNTIEHLLNEKTKNKTLVLPENYEMPDYKSMEEIIRESELVRNKTLVLPETYEMPDYKSMEEIRKHFELVRKQEKDYTQPLEVVNTKLGEISDNTGDLVDAMTDTTSQFFQETGDIFARSAAAILGFTPDDKKYEEELVELTRIIAAEAGKTPFVSVAEGGQ